MAQDELLFRHLEWDACNNARDLGGYPTASGYIRPQTLIRADGLHQLTPTGQQALREYGVRTIIDLRLGYELEMDPNPFASAEQQHGSLRYLHLPLLDEETDAVLDAADPLDNYVLIVELNKALVAAVIKAVATGLEDGAVLAHCFAGKDRTGIVIALLLDLLGTPREVILADFMQTETRLEKVNQAWLAKQAEIAGNPIEKPDWMYVRPQKIERLLDLLDREYGGTERFLLGIGVTPEEIAVLRERLNAPANIND